MAKRPPPVAATAAGRSRPCKRRLTRQGLATWLKSDAEPAVRQAPRIPRARGARPGSSPLTRRSSAMRPRRAVRPRSWAAALRARAGGTGLRERTHEAGSGKGFPGRVCATSRRGDGMTLETSEKDEIEESQGGDSAWTYCAPGRPKERGGESWAGAGGLEARRRGGGRGSRAGDVCGWEVLILARSARSARGRELSSDEIKAYTLQRPAYTQQHPFQATNQHPHPASLDHRLPFAASAPPPPPPRSWQRCPPLAHSSSSTSPPSPARPPRFPSPTRPSSPCWPPS